MHSLHQSDVEVYPIHPRKVETSFRARAASVATEFRVRVNSVTAVRNAAGSQGTPDDAASTTTTGAGRMRSATVNATLFADGNVRGMRVYEESFGWPFASLRGKTIQPHIVLYCMLYCKCFP